MPNFFKKIITLSILIFISISSISLAEIVNKIKIQGNDRISDETIKMFSKINIGDDVNEKDLNDILKDIYNSSFFKDVKVSLSNNVLNIKVIENPLVENIEIEGPKAKKIVELLKKNLRIKARSSYNELLLKSDKKKMRNDLKEIGYYFSEVDVLIEDLGDNKVNLIYKIKMEIRLKLKRYLLLVIKFTKTESLEV